MGEKWQNIKLERFRQEPDHGRARVKHLDFILKASRGFLVGM